MSRLFSHTCIRKATLIAACITLVSSAGNADDRELLRERGADPYVFIIFDTSGSMYWSSVCSAEDACEDIDPWDGACTSVCPFDEVGCPQVCPDWGCVEYGNADLAPKIELEVDDTVAGPGDIQGTWSIVPLPDALGGNAYTSEADNASIRLRQSVTETRRYKLFLHVPQSVMWSTAVTVEVSGVAEPVTATIDQRGEAIVDGADDYDPWRLVGVYEAIAGSEVSARVRTAGANGAVVVDGLRLVSEVKECLEEGYRCQQELCPSGDCFVPLNADGPQSKMFQAKASMYEVLGEVTNVRFGFATYEQDNLKVRGKHWLYRVRERDPDLLPNDGIDPPLQEMLTLDEGTTLPRPGVEEVFGLAQGEGWNCDTGSNDNNIGCYRTWPADLGDAWERERTERLPKLGRNQSLSTTFHVREDNRNDRIYLVEYAPVAGYDVGDELLAVRVRAWRCDYNSCARPGSPLVDEKTIFYDRVSDFIAWDNGARRGGARRGYFSQGHSGDASAVNTCGHDHNGVRSGWDPNDDSTGLGSQDDIYSNVNLRWPTTADPRSTAANKRAFDVGDVVPWDWQDGADHREEIQERLAPNTVGETGERPDFRTAVYLNDEVLSGDSPDSNGARRLRFRNEAERPLVPDGATPIGYAMANFEQWLLEFGNEATQVTDSGATIDPDWSCREKFVLFLTDGDDTCSFNGSGNLVTNGINPSNVASTLFGRDVKTYVVGFGLADDGDGTLDCTRAPDQLACMAARGGTEEPIYPKNQDELVNALLDIFGEVSAESRAFASASLPAQQSTAADKIFFSSFTPLPDRSYWAGRVDVFREPLLNVIEPPICDSCVTLGLESGCHLYNVAETILRQAPLDIEINADPPNGNVGTGINERRVLYPTASSPVKADGTMAQPQSMRLFSIPDLDGSLTTQEQALRDDFEEVFLDDTQKFANDETRKGHLERVYRRTLRVKNSSALADATECNTHVPLGPPEEFEDGDYLMGDVFHANPLISSGPNNLRFFRPNLCGEVTPAANTPSSNCPLWASTDEEDAFKRGYRNFVRRDRWYRRMLTVATNDGQLHFFDAGIRNIITDPNTHEELEVFSDGTGAEIFSYMPRITMPIVREQAADDATQIFSLDGSLTIGEVLVDPVFALDPEPDDREWRTVVVGGLREGGDRFNDSRDIDGFVSGYYALDITQPDGLTVIDNDPTDFRDDEYIPDAAVAGGVLPSCLEIDAGGNQIANTGTACKSTGGEQVPFPALKWEFTDRLYFFDNDGDSDDESGWYELDEDQNGVHDLGATWSKPLVSQVLVLDGTDETTRWVAIFGGGLDPLDKSDPTRGNWLYMVDIETGVTIYKRPVVGAVPSDITGLDVNTDGIIDRLYFTTTGGFLYKVDLTSPGIFGNQILQALDADIPPDGDLEGILRWPDTTVTVNVERVLNPEWEPFAIFDAEGRQLYQPPAVVAVQEREQFALAFGTGDREDLWEFDGVAGRFYAILDDDFENPSGMPTDLPYTEADFINIDFDAPLLQLDLANGGLIPGEGRGPAAPNFLTDLDHLDGLGTQLGWVMRFPAEARITNRAFVLTGVLVFTAFQPQIDPELGDDQALCRRTGISRTFVLDVRNANAITTLENFRDASFDNDRPLQGGDGDPPGGGVVGDPLIVGKCGDRCLEREGFGTAPFVSSGATKNPTTQGALTTSTLDPLQDPVLRRLLENLKQTFFPPGCSFNDSFYEMIRMQFDDTGVQNLVPVPIGVCPSEWAAGTSNWSTD